MRAPQERNVRDLYDRTKHKDLAAPEEPPEGRGGGGAEGSGRRELVSRMDGKTTVRKKMVSSDISRVKVESGTCNVCYAPCTSCQHQGVEHAGSNVNCGSSQTCSTRSEIKNNSLTRNEKGGKGVRNTGENDDEVSSSNASFSETGGNKLVRRSSIAEDSSEVDMPAKRRRLTKQDTKLSRVEYLDDDNSCVTGMPAEGKLLEKKKLSTSASSCDLTVQDSKDNSIASRSRLRKQHIDESTEKNRSDTMHPSSSIMTKKLLRTQSSVSVSKELSPKRQTHELGEAQENLSHQRFEKASHSKNIIEQTLGGTSNPCVDAGDNNDMLTGFSGSTRNERKAGLSPKILESDTSCSKDQIQQRAVVQTNDDSKRNGVDKQDRDQDSSMDISNNGDSNIQNDVMTDCGNSEGLIDVNVCDICGDVGREYLLATCTRCLEGAEHTYCMRVKLDKVPDGEWLCEECQLKEKHSTGFKYDVETANISEGKKQSSGSQNNNKALRVVVPDMDTLRIKCNTPTADQCDSKNKKLHLSSADTPPPQVKATNPAAERLEAKDKKILSMTNRKKLQVTASDLEARSHTGGIAVPGSSNKKNQSSEFQLNRKKLRVSTDMELPLSSEGLRSPPISCKRLAENTSSPNRRLLKANNVKNPDVFCRENSFKKSNEGSMGNAALRNSQAVKSSQTLSRSYSMGSMANAKAAVTSPRGLLSKQMSFNSPNKGPKVKQLAEGFASKLRPAQHSQKDSRDQGPIKRVMKSGSFKSEGSVCKDAGSSKQKQSFHVPQDEKQAILKSTKEKNMMERRPSFSFKKPNIPSSPRPDSSMKSGERKLDPDISRPGPSILKTSKKPGNLEKERSEFKTDKHETSVDQKPTGFVSGKDIYAVNIPDPPVPSQCVKRESLIDGEEVSFIPVKDDNGMPTEPLEVRPSASDDVSLGSDFPDMIQRVNATEELTSKVVGLQQKPLERSVNGSCKIVEATQLSDGTLPESPHGLQIDNGYPSDKLDKPNLKQEAFLDQSTPENPLRHLVIPEQYYIWQGSFEVSRHGIPEIFDGIQAYLSTCASFKVRELGKQLPHKIQLAEVPRHSSWPLQFKEVNPTEDSIGLFFFAKDGESYERAYRKLLDDMLLGDLSLTANIDGIELLIFPSDKLPERTQRWNGSLFFWGIFYARKASSLPELPVKGTNNCLIVPVAEPVIQQDVCSPKPKVLQSLVIDLNECPTDDLSDPAISLGSEMEKIGTSTDQNIRFNSKHEDGKLNPCEIHHEETAGTRQIVAGHPAAAPCETLFCVAPPAGAIRPVTGEMVVKKQVFQPSVEASPLHFNGSKISDEPTKLIPKSGIGSSDFDSDYKRQKTSHGKHFGSSFEELPSKCFSKIHPLPAAQSNPFDDAQFIYRDPSDSALLQKAIPDHVIHVLSSDDEDSPEPSTSLNNKASLKADAGSSPLLSLSLSTAAAKPNLTGSDIGEDEPVSLSLGLPGVVEGSRVLEMKQFLPEKPGINT